MANIKIIVDGPLMDGHKVTFKAPCDCSIIEYLDIRYVKDGTQASKLFTMKDTHGNDLTGLGNLFEEGAYVHAILDTTRGFAYLQNADTNKYIEERFDALTNDYVVAQGKSGSWTYKKWNSGFAEMWFDGNVTTEAINTGNGNLYFSDAIYLYLPFTLTGYARGAAEAIDPWTMAMVNGGGPNDITVKLYRGSAYNNTVSCSVCVYVYGYWK